MLCLRCKWRLSDDFVKLVPYLIFVNTDNFLRLQSPHAQMLATYINDSFVKSGKRTDDTIAGLPITISAKTLADKAGLGDSNPTVRYRLLTENLNEIRDRGIIAKWATGDGDTVIRSQNNKLPKVVIFPSENVSNSYVSKRLNAGAKQQERLEQAKRQDELRTLLNYYRKDLKQNKWATEYKQALAEDLGTTTAGAELLRAGAWGRFDQVFTATAVMKLDGGDYALTATADQGSDSQFLDLTAYMLKIS